MYAVEFEAPIKDGIVRIPKEYKDLQDKREFRGQVLRINLKQEFYKLTKGLIGFISSW